MRWLFLAALVAIVVANTELPANWKANEYGVCTLPYIEGSTSERPPYTGANANPLIAEAVGSGSRGRTCNFNPGGNALSGMSALYTDHWVLAASQSLYNGRKMPLDWSGDDCPPGDYSQAEALSSDMCGALCGVCVLISGPQGSAVFMVNEIADANAVQQNGVGINLHLDNDHRGEIRAGGGVGKDIQFAFVSCPTDDGIYFRTFGWYAESAVYLVAYNYKNRLVSVENRGSGAGADTTWVPLVRSWTNRWQWDSQPGDERPDFQEGLGSIFRGSEVQQFDLRLTDIEGNQLICFGMGRTEAGDIVRCLDQNGVHQQFPDVPIAVDTGCTGTATKNLQYYQGRLPQGSPVSDPSNPGTATPSPSAPAASSTPAVSSTPTASSTPAAVSGTPAASATSAASQSRQAAASTSRGASSTPQALPTSSAAPSASRTRSPAAGASRSPTASPNTPRDLPTVSIAPASPSAAPSSSRTPVVIDSVSNNSPVDTSSTFNGSPASLSDDGDDSSSSGSVLAAAVALGLCALIA